jgi:hypothetical protein
MNAQQSRRPTVERHSESRMRENRPYGSMRGDAGPMTPTTTVGSIHSPPSPTLLTPFYHRPPNVETLGYCRTSLKDEDEILAALGTDVLAYL